MRFSTLIGILLGLAAILGAFYMEGGSFSKLILPAPLLIVIGGTLMAGLASSSWKVFSKILILIGKCFFPPRLNKQKIALQIIEYSLLTRKFGMLTLEDKLVKAENLYLKKFFQIGLDGGDGETLTENYEMEVEGITMRHGENISLFNKLGGLSPTMGIIGTVLGLITTMGAAAENADADALIANIAVAFLATLWGIALANVVWIPIADKLQTIHNDEMDVLTMIYNGAKSVFTGDSPLVVISKLSSSYPLSEQAQFQRTAKSFADKQRKLLKTDK
ncbi:MAG: MotA/TolQ/ExbB proton channel family protein [Bacteroidetes bacterium]|nr:MotA/TolQ/ExbB proton channel family protein [Bacteroidota bacterium]